jgi:hypothetical protein
MPSSSRRKFTRPDISWPFYLYRKEDAGPAQMIDKKADQSIKTVVEELRGSFLTAKLDLLRTMMPCPNRYFLPAYVSHIGGSAKDEGTSLSA